jgi:hypothetical protein
VLVLTLALGGLFVIGNNVYSQHYNNTDIILSQLVCEVCGGELTTNPCDLCGQRYYQSMAYCPGSGMSLCCTTEQRPYFCTSGACNC